MATTRQRREFAICIADEGYDDLNVWKIYKVLPDAKAAEVGCLRVVDESGEDYLYPADPFSVSQGRAGAVACRGRALANGALMPIVLF